MDQEKSRISNPRQLRVLLARHTKALRKQYADDKSILRIINNQPAVVLKRLTYAELEKYGYNRFIERIINNQPIVRVERLSNAELEKWGVNRVIKRFQSVFPLIPAAALTKPTGIFQSFLEKVKSSYEQCRELICQNFNNDFKILMHAQEHIENRFAALIYECEKEIMPTLKDSFKYMKELIRANPKIKILKFIREEFFVLLLLYYQQGFSKLMNVEGQKWKVAVRKQLRTLLKQIETPEFKPIQKSFLWPKEQKHQLEREIKKAMKVFKYEHYDCSGLNNYNCNTLCENQCENKSCSKKLLTLKKTLKKGWGLFSLEEINEDEIVEDLRGKITFSDLIGNEHYTACLFGKIYMDTTEFGNIGRFINHSCEPNTSIEIIFVNKLPKIIFKALKKINVNDEITFDYNNNDIMAVCECGSIKCKRLR